MEHVTEELKKLAEEIVKEYETNLRIITEVSEYEELSETVMLYLSAKALLKKYKF